MNKKTFSHRAGKLFRVLVWVFATLLTLLFLAQALLAWYGGRRWQETQARVAREGESLDIRAGLKPALADSENGAALEPLRDIALVVSNDPENGVPGERRQALRRLDVSRFRGHGLPDWDWDQVAETLHREGSLDALPAAGQAAAAVRDFLKRGQPLLPDLLARSATTHDAEFLPPPADRIGGQLMMTMPTAHLDALSSMVGILEMYGAASADAGDAEGAMAALDSLFLLGKGMEREPMYLAYVHSLHVDETVLDLLRYLLKKKALDSAQLLRAENGLAAMDHAARLLFAQRTEMAAAVQMMDALSGPQAAKQGLPFPGGGGAMRQWFFSRLFQLNKVHMVEVSLDAVIPPLRDGSLREARLAIQEAERSMQKGGVLSGLDRLFARMVIPSQKQMVNLAVQFQTRSLQAGLACALERYRLEKGVYPERLEALVPAFLPAIPVNPSTGQPMDYHREAENRFRLEATAPEHDGREIWSD